MKVKQDNPDTPRGKSPSLYLKNITPHAWKLKSSVKNK